MQNLRIGKPPKEGNRLGIEILKQILSIRLLAGFIAIAIAKWVQSANAHFGAIAVVVTKVKLADNGLSLGYGQGGFRDAGRRAHNAPPSAATNTRVCLLFESRAAKRQDFV